MPNSIEPSRLKRVLRLKDLIFLSIGAVVGAGIFGSVGTAAAGSGERLGAGPALVVSFLLLGVACALAALCYAEMASMTPKSGSAYRWKGIVSSMGKKGTAVLKKFPYVGIFVSAGMLAYTGPKAAAAEALGISETGLDALLEGKASIHTRLWQPAGDVVSAALSDGSVIKLGDAYQYAHYDGGGLVTKIEHGEIWRIEPLSEIGYVNIYIKLGQEVRPEPRICSMRDGEPEEGVGLPLGWRN